MSGTKQIGSRVYEEVIPPGTKKAARAREETAVLRQVLMALVLKYSRASSLEVVLTAEELREAKKEEMELRIETSGDRIYLGVKAKQ